MGHHTRPHIPKLLYIFLYCECKQIKIDSLQFRTMYYSYCNNVRKEGRKRTGLAWKDSGEIYSDKLKQLRTLRALKTSTLSVVSAITFSIRFGCLPLTDRAPESSLRLSPRVPTPRWLYWVSPRQLLQSDTGVPHFALDPLTYRCLLSLSPAADFAEPRPPHHIPPPPDSGREALRPAAPPPHSWRGSRLQLSASPACGSP